MLLPRSRGLLALASAAIQILWGSSGAAQEAGDPQRGRATATTICANCHLVNERQSGPAMDSAPSFDALARDRAMTETRLRGFLNRPHPPMPDPQLSRQQIEDIVAYLGELRRRAM